MIKLLRVDHRLLHGQVAVSWSSYLGIDCILLANDELLKDPLMMTSVKLAKPQGVKVVAKTVADSIEAVKSGVTDKYKLFIVCGNVADACRLARELSIGYINLGETRASEGRKSISTNVFINKEEKGVLTETMDAGVRIEIQGLPSQKSVNLRNALKKF
ncbi:MAG: PTS sugar transporter subunit IIB [Dorea sp.]|jgi:fructoselysine and glucoselysine-specific PTS system IIB component|nr:PTS sugar transporter subunit IIB [Dorea sp.]MCI9272008.1 PTS sugar transporter subunit IIB [Dorea sp.]